MIEAAPVSITPSIWDVAAARASRDMAVADVEVRAAPWVAVAREALLAVAERQVSLTSDDVWQELERRGVPAPEEGRAMGPVMKRAMREGVIEPVGYTQGTNPKHHADVMRVYRSLVTL
jgi:hypothetical protein